MQIMQMVALASLRDGGWTCRAVSAPGLGICSWCPQTWCGLFTCSPNGAPEFSGLQHCACQSDSHWSLQISCLVVRCPALWNLCTIFCSRWCFKASSLSSCIFLATSGVLMGWTDHCTDPELFLCPSFPLQPLNSELLHLPTPDCFICGVRASSVKLCFVWGLQHLAQQGC